jgi:hypothetical protein
MGIMPLGFGNTLCQPLVGLVDFCSLRLHARKRPARKGKREKKKKKGKAGKMNAQPQRLNIYRTLTTEHLQTTTSTLTNKPNPPVLLLFSHYSSDSPHAPNLSLPSSLISFSPLSSLLSLSPTLSYNYTSLSLTLINNTWAHSLSSPPRPRSIVPDRMLSYTFWWWPRGLSIDPLFLLSRRYTPRDEESSLR